MIGETGREVFGVSSGQRKDGKKTLWLNKEVQESFQRKKRDTERTEESTVIQGVAI